MTRSRWSGRSTPSEVGSELSKLRGCAPVGELPAVQAGAIRVAHEAVRARVRSGAFRSAHDIAEGGVAAALAECCIAGDLGASVRLPHGLDPFGEAPGRGFIVSGPREALAGFVVIGEVGGDALSDRGAARARSFRAAVGPGERSVRMGLEPLLALAAGWAWRLP